jgi:hypothetical protein
MAPTDGLPRNRWFEPPAYYLPALSIILGVFFLFISLSAGYTEPCPAPSCPPGANCTSAASCYSEPSLFEIVARVIGVVGAIGGAGFAIAGSVIRRRHPLPTP